MLGDGCWVSNGVVRVTVGGVVIDTAYIHTHHLPQTQRQAHTHSRLTMAINTGTAVC